jgi:hypothetical protein
MRPSNCFTQGNNSRGKQNRAVGRHPDQDLSVVNSDLAAEIDLEKNYRFL